MIFRRSIKGILQSLPGAKGSFLFCAAKATQEQSLQQFKNLLLTNTKQSLEQGAKMYAKLEVKVEENQAKISQLESAISLALQNCPANTPMLIQMIQDVQSNIELRKEEIDLIENRAEKELSDCRNFSISKIAKEMLQVADSLQKCQKLAEAVCSSNKEVLKAIQEANIEIKSIFQIYGIYQFDPLGEVYDPNTQEALVQAPIGEGKKAGTVAFTMRTGYTIKGRLLRSAHVGIYV